MVEEILDRKSYMCDSLEVGKSLFGEELSFSVIEGQLSEGDIWYKIYLEKLVGLDYSEYCGLVY